MNVARNFTLIFVFNWFPSSLESSDLPRRYLETKLTKHTNYAWYTGMISISYIIYIHGLYLKKKLGNLPRFQKTLSINPEGIVPIFQRIYTSRHWHVPRIAWPANYPTNAPTMAPHLKAAKDQGAWHNIQLYTLEDSHFELKIMELWFRWFSIRGFVGSSR